jgi:hypothetical protein
MLACLAGAWKPQAMKANRRHGVMFNRPEHFWHHTVMLSFKLRPFYATENNPYCPSDWILRGLQGLHVRDAGAKYPCLGRDSNHRPPKRSHFVESAILRYSKRRYFLQLPHGSIRYDCTANTEAVKTMWHAHWRIRTKWWGKYFSHRAMRHKLHNQKIHSL